MSIIANLKNIQPSGVKEIYMIKLIDMSNFISMIILSIVLHKLFFKNVL